MKYTSSHEWIKIDNDIGTVGITEFAQKELGEVVYVELPMIGKQVKLGEEVAVLESTKAAADIYAPVSGEIIEINQRLHDFSEKINSSPEESGWLFKVKMTNKNEIEELLSKEQYMQLIC
jgi:glycine cleavage system H protein